ncbi:MAG TPA: ECF transporter S component [Tetragenococcus sp.]|nr:ECF transporter S component [Tetragenococcus sp.]
MRSTTRDIVMIALFTAFTTVATMIKIPLPTGAFVHLGNAVLLLSVLFLGYVKGSLAGGLGFAIFDLMNGYAAEAPYFIVESFVIGAAAYGTFLLFKKKPVKIWQILVIATTTGIAKLLMTQIKNTIRQLYLGMNFSTAFVTAAFSLPATIVNVFLTAIIVSFLYFPLKKALFSILN